MKTAARET